MPNRNLLIIDDDQWLLDSMQDWLSGQGFSVVCATSVSDGQRLLQKQRPDLCLVDVNLDGPDGFELLSWCKQKSIDTPIVMMSGYAAPDSAVEAVAAGAFDLLTKPIIDQELLTTLCRAADQKQIVEENQRLKHELDRRSGLENILSHDPRMVEIFDVINSVADTKATILITGENGTGKSMIARAIHRRSSRKTRPFVEVACGALPDNLLESELFGHTSNAFTGANTAKIGKFQHADTGSIFLDEIGTSSVAMQIKLLRVLQEFQFEAVGGNETIAVDTRCILATNENLEQAVAEGKFRQDLYYRINVIHIELPALRERTSDIPLLIEHFLQKSLREVTKEVDGFTDEAVETMMGYAWPGNIRELENVVQRAVLLTKTRDIGIDLLPSALLSASTPRHNLCSITKGQTLREALEGPERQIILDVLRANSFSRNLTAEQLGINRTTLYKKMKRLGIEGLQFQD
ncbi:sigma-54-dependent transcriptional regulator [Aureliella helgolandensis]|uniref:Transcriptional regulatory protein ZraR n=1 Tax=Aureliella helgolandensis TaxID=2527968 RepID=A0A518GEM8_9BACT|nr:sigma-54 dependent transcriptional regulator [Aureliella helgolandensis]QDV27055.1 Transcriptional regulatory protein ZraR [Aureliella helgolandensis]